MVAFEPHAATTAVSASEVVTLEYRTAQCLPLCGPDTAPLKVPDKTAKFVLFFRNDARDELSPTLFRFHQKNVVVV
jgi:hypothetical protein